MTAARLLLIVPFVHFVLAANHVAAGCTALLAMLTDLDGTVARAIGGTSKFGSLFDPIVDVIFEIIGFTVLLLVHALAIAPVVFFVAATAFKAIPQTRYLRVHGKVKSILVSKTMGMVGFGSVVAAAFGAPLWCTSIALTLGAAGYVVLGVRWLTVR